MTYSPANPSPTQRIISYILRARKSLYTRERPLSKSDLQAYEASIARTALKYADIFEDKGKPVELEKIKELLAVKVFKKIA